MGMGRRKHVLACVSGDWAMTEEGIDSYAFFTLFGREEKCFKDVVYRMRDILK